MGIVILVLLARSRHHLKKIAENSLDEAISSVGKITRSPSWQHLKANIQKEVPQRTPQKLTVSYDIMHSTIDSLQRGFILDYDLKTWEVAYQTQFEWENVHGEGELKNSS
ncbi:MAG: hypothetical protein NZ521_00370 [Flammeovirgaceae bacterium]|nr:hypothetical protein [Flammeovirgaceae bacterium]MDW8286508.1 hypothetical protein [Flammeovirgaceae bacterium]